jgi:hypothetical protein
MRGADSGRQGVQSPRPNHPKGKDPTMNLAPLETLSLETPVPHVLVVRLNRPQVSNALNTQMGLDLYSVWSGLFQDAGDIRCVVFAAAGDRAFCGGGDLKERNGMTDEAWKRQHEIFERAFWAQLDCPIPIIAAVSGHAYAGGLEMVLASDFAYGVSTARFALTEVTIGIMPGAGGTQTLPRVVGERREALHRGAGAGMGHPQPGLRAGRADAGGDGDGNHYRRQCPAFGPPGEEIHPFRPADGYPHRAALRDRGL